MARETNEGTGYTGTKPRHPSAGRMSSSKMEQGDSDSRPSNPPTHRTLTALCDAKGIHWESQSETSRPTSLSSAACVSQDVLPRSVEI